MYTEHELICTLKGSLIRILFPGACFGSIVENDDCVYYLRVVGEQILDQDLRRNCTEEETVAPLPLDPELIVIIVMAVILVMIIVTIAINRNRQI